MSALISDAKLAANRANAQHSTGPVTEEGKVASSKNALKLGFTGRFILLEREDQADFDKLRERLRAEHQPATDTERILVNNMAKHHWLANRALFQQAICFEVGPGKVADRRLALMMRYQTTNERAFQRDLSQLQKLRKEREARETGFVSQSAKIGALMRNAEADELKLKLLRAKAERVPKPTQSAPTPAAPEAPLADSPQISFNFGSSGEKSTHAAA